MYMAKRIPAHIRLQMILQDEGIGLKNRVVPYETTSSGGLTLKPQLEAYYKDEVKKPVKDDESGEVQTESKSEKKPAKSR
jgi:hypothetical protein